MITYFHKNKKTGYSISKVSQTFIKEVQKKINIEEFYVPCHRADLISVIRNILYIFKHRNIDGINHITGDIHYCALALIGTKSVLTIHDHNIVYRTKNPVKRNIFKILWYSIPLKIINKIVCISNYTKDCIIRYTKRNDIMVINNAVDSLFQPVIKKINEKKPIILQIGTGWNKNLINISFALSSITCHLRVIGKLSLEQQNILNKNNIEYSEKSNLTDKEIIEEYKNCDIVCFCSVFEGFGMPIIEGNATGRCVITSAQLPMTEIAGNAACLVNPSDVDSIHKGFIKIISDGEYRNQLVINGLENVKKFQPVYASKQYLELYNSMLE
jgi:glycosyltransferase involved in cell wall biosynthesis